MEQVNPNVYSKLAVKTLCKFYRFDLRAILNYLQMVLRKKHLTKDTFLSELKHDLGEQTSYFDVMDRLFFQGKSHYWSGKIEDFRRFSRLRLLSEGRFGAKMDHLEMAYFAGISRGSKLDPYKKNFQVQNERQKDTKNRREWVEIFWIFIGFFSFFFRFF